MIIIKRTVCREGERERERVLKTKNQTNGPTVNFSRSGSFGKYHLITITNVVLTS